MNLAGFLAVLAIQVGIFLVPLAMAPMGLVSGEMAGLSAIVTWFVLGTPLSYAVLDRAKARRVRAPAPEAIPQPRSMDHSLSNASFSGGPVN